MNLYYLNNNHPNYFSDKKYNDIKKDHKCLQHKNNIIQCQPDVIHGYSQPLNEKCTLITGQLRDGPEKGCSSLWNNLTRRKSLIIKDKRNNHIL